MSRSRNCSGLALRVQNSLEPVSANRNAAANSLSWTLVAGSKGEICQQAGRRERPDVGIDSRTPNVRELQSRFLPRCHKFPAILLAGFSADNSLHLSNRLHLNI